MTTPDKFIDYIKRGYSSKGMAAALGSAMLGGEVLKGVLVSAPLRTAAAC
jgi:hypothetical protein